MGELTFQNYLINMFCDIRLDVVTLLLSLFQSHESEEPRLRCNAITIQPAGRISPRIPHGGLRMLRSPQFWNGAWPKLRGIKLPSDERIVVYRVAFAYARAVDLNSRSIGP